MFTIVCMRGLLAVSIGVTLSLSPLSPAAATPTARPAPAPLAAPAASGSTQSPPPPPPPRARGPPPGAPRRTVHPFSLLGVVWDNPTAHLDGTVQARTRATGTETWSDWQDLETHADDHGADPGTPEHDSTHPRGGTAPLWVGDSDGIELRVRPEMTGTRALPTGLRAELVDPGTEDALVVGPPRARARIGAPAADTVVPALPRTLPHGGPRPRIVTRKGWGADEKLREKKFSYTKSVKAAFVHHTATGNRYRCSQAASVIRGIYRYHVKSMGWKDIGYNFLVDKCGTIYEGRAGGVTRPVLGAHTLGFNANSVGIAVIGTYGGIKPSAAAVKAVAQVSAWKLGIYGVNPRGTTYLKSAGGNLYRKGKNVRLNVISGHRDGFATDCPGRLLYGKLATARSSAARYQGR